MTIILIRTVIVFFSITIALRLMGKRQLGELELSELVVAILISDLAANPLQDIGIPLLNGLLPIVVLLCCELLISGFIVKSATFRSLVCGRPSILVENGQISESEMRRNRFTLDELAEELRGRPFVSQRSDTDADIQNYLKHNDLNVHISCYVIDDESMVEMVACGQGVAIMPQLLLTRQGAASSVQVLALEPPSGRSIGLACLDRNSLSPAAREFGRRIRLFSKEL